MRKLRSLNTPAKIQKFLDALLTSTRTRRGLRRRVLRERAGHCMEGALLAAAALRVNGHPPLLMDLEAVRDDDHVVALYREHGLWGGIAKSNYAGLRFRAPIYRTLRELALSYFEHYYNLRGERTLRAYSGAVNLARFDRQHWMTSEEDVWCVPEYLAEVRHYPLFPKKVAKHPAAPRPPQLRCRHARLGQALNLRGIATKDLRCTLGGRRCDLASGLRRDSRLLLA